MTWRAEVERVLGVRIEAAEPVAGGDINEAYRVRLADRRVVFVKTHASPPPGMFAAEAAGLDWLRAGPLRVPRVIGHAEAFLALEWLELGPRERAFDRRLGEGLAQLHRVGAPSFGHAEPSYLATLSQDNTAESDVVTHWIERRVRPLCTRARLGLDRELDALARLPDRFGPPELPARLHGDLWWGNLAASEHAAVLIDPAVYGGHREVDLAMLALFGGLPASLIEGYDEMWPLADDWRARIPLWQLYPLAAHAVLFGGGYGAQVAEILRSLA